MKLSAEHINNLKFLMLLATFSLIVYLIFSLEERILESF